MRRNNMEDFFKKIVKDRQQRDFQQYLYNTDLKSIVSMSFSPPSQNRLLKNIGNTDLTDLAVANNTLKKAWNEKDLATNKVSHSTNENIFVETGIEQQLQPSEIFTKAPIVYLVNDAEATNHLVKVETMIVPQSETRDLESINNNMPKLIRNYDKKIYLRRTPANSIIQGEPLRKRVKKSVKSSSQQNYEEQMKILNEKIVQLVSCFEEQTRVIENQLSQIWSCQYQQLHIEDVQELIDTSKNFQSIQDVQNHCNNERHKLETKLMAEITAIQKKMSLVDEISEKDDVIILPKKNLQYLDIVLRLKQNNNPNTNYCLSSSQKITTHCQVCHNATDAEEEDQDNKNNSYVNNNKKNFNFLLTNELDVCQRKNDFSGSIIKTKKRHSFEREELRTPFFATSSSSGRDIIHTNNDSSSPSDTEWKITAAFAKDIDNIQQHIHMRTPPMSSSEIHPNSHRKKRILGKRDKHHLTSPLKSSSPSVSLVHASKSKREKQQNQISAFDRCSNVHSESNVSMNSEHHNHNFMPMRTNIQLRGESTNLFNSVISELKQKNSKLSPIIGDI